MYLQAVNNAISMPID